MIFMVCFSKNLILKNKSVDDKKSVQNCSAAKTYSLDLVAYTRISFRPR